MNASMVALDQFNTVVSVGIDPQGQLEAILDRIALTARIFGDDFDAIAVAAAAAFEAANDGANTATLLARFLPPSP